MFNKTAARRFSKIIEERKVDNTPAKDREVVIETTERNPENQYPRKIINCQH